MGFLIFIFGRKTKQRKKNKKTNRMRAYICRTLFCNATTSNRHSRSIFIIKIKWKSKNKRNTNQKRNSMKWGRNACAKYRLRVCWKMWICSVFYLLKDFVFFFLLCFVCLIFFFASLFDFCYSCVFCFCFLAVK